MAPLSRAIPWSAPWSAAARRSRRRSASTRLGGLERLEAKTPLTVEASLSGGLLTLNYLYPTDAAVLAFVSDGTFAVTGDVSGATSGSSAEVTQIFVMNLGNLEGIPFEYDSTQFTITGSASVAAGLIVGDFSGANGGIQTVTLSVPGFSTNGGDFSVVGGTLTIAGQIDTSGASGLAGGGTAGDVTIMALAGGISLPSAIIATGGDGSAGGGSGGGVALVASGAIAVDGAIEASGGSGGTAGGNGGAVKITAGTSVVVSGAIETYGTGGGTVGGSGGAVTITAGTSAAVGGDIETYGGSGGTAGGSGGAVTITAGEAISTEAINAAAGGRYATAGVVTIDQDDPGVTTSARASSTIRAAARPSGRVAVGRIAGGDVSIKAAEGVIYLVGDMIINGEGAFDGPVELGLPVRVDSSFEAGGVTFTSTVDGRHPLVVAAGTGAVSFQGAVGATRPLAGLRLESAGSVTAAAQVHLAGGVAGALRHGIEIAPTARNVNLAQGGSIRGFRSGQAIHAPGGSEGSTISGFRIANSGRPFVGYSAAGGTTIGTNQVVSPVVRPATARITTPAGRTNDSTPTLVGTARSGDLVTLYADATPVGSTVAVNGRWSITSGVVADGRRSFAVRAVRPTGVAAGFSRPVILSITSANLQPSDRRS